MYSSEDIAKNSTIFPSEENADQGGFNENGTPIIKVVGVGGGGDNAVNHMYNQGISGVSFVVTNTDRQALFYADVSSETSAWSDCDQGNGCRERSGTCASGC